MARWDVSVAWASAEQEEGEGRGDDDPRPVVSTGDQDWWHLLGAHVRDDRLRRDREPRDRVERDEEKAHDVDREHHGMRCEARDERLVRRIAARDRPHEQQQVDHEPCDEDAADLAQNELYVRPLSQPPIRGHAWPQPLGMMLAVDLWVCHASGVSVRQVSCVFAPRGSTSDFAQSIAAVSLYRWMAPAGSTCFGHTSVHSPTNVHPQMPSCCDRICMRSALPSSRESRL